MAAHLWTRSNYTKRKHIFSGPLNQPIINVEAVRNPASTENNVVVGIRIISLINAPKIEIFSDPIMPRQEVLSYLLQGHGLDKNQHDGTDINLHID